MQVELPPYIALLWLFPGLFFSICYLKGIKEYSRNDNLKLLSFHSFFAVIFVAIYLLLGLVLSLILNNIFPIERKILQMNWELKFIFMILFYLFSYCIAFWAGNYLCKKQYSYDFIKPDSHWNKIFFKHKSEKIDFFVTTVVETGGKTWLYVGMLDDYLTSNGELEYIQLVKPYRRTIREDESPQEKDEFKKRFYKISVDCLIIKYSDIKSLGIQSISVNNISSDR